MSKQPKRSNPDAKFRVLSQELAKLENSAKTTAEKIRRADPRHDVLVVMAAAAGVLFVSVMTVLVVRALLTAVTNPKINPFAPMTYTNTDIVEPTTSFTYTDETGSAGSYTVTVNKSAKVQNLSGTDKKPVFIRVAVTWSVYDAEGVNVTSAYPITGLTFEEGTNWHKNADGYHYYKYVVNPGGMTDELFKSNITVTLGEKLPNGYKIEIDVIADTVQAVSHDSSLWTSDDYELNDAAAAWGKTVAALQGDDYGKMVTATKS